MIFADFSLQFKTVPLLLLTGNRLFKNLQQGGLMGIKLSVHLKQLHQPELSILYNVVSYFSVHVHMYVNTIII